MASLENIVILSNWVARGNHDGKNGINHSYIKK